MRFNNFRIIFLFAILSFFSCSNINDKAKPNSLDIIINYTKEINENLDELIKKQQASTDVEEMFALDDIILEEKNKIALLLKLKIEEIEDKTINFEQTSNLDKVLIKNVKISGAKYNEILIQAEVEAINNSAFAGPYVGFTALDSNGNILNLSGGISLDSNVKLEKGKIYIFGGSIFNINNSDTNFDRLVFGEDIKQW
jgi:hypothetical protein